MMTKSNESENVGGAGAGYYLGLIAKVVLAIAMLLYLGMHSYNFFSFTFKGDQWIFSILGLFTTSIGFILWLAIYLYAAEEGLERAVTIIMMFVSLLGEFAVAGFDMYMNITDTLATAAFTAEDLRNMSYIIAGLALLNGLALVAGVAGQQIMDDLSNVNVPKFRKPAKKFTPSVTPVTVKATDTNRVTLIDHEIAASINPMAAPYRACPNCDDLVPLSAAKCGKCGTLMSPLPNVTKTEERPAEIPFHSNGQSH